MPTTCCPKLPWPPTQPTNRTPPPQRKGPAHSWAFSLHCGTVSGTGDSVLILLAEAATATVTGNAAGSHFAVIGYGGLFPDLLVNTTDPYEGEVLVDRNSRVFVVTAVGDWTIELTAR